MPVASPPDRSSLRRLGLVSFFRPREAAAKGIAEPALRTLVRRGVIERVGRGLYRVVSNDVGEHPVLASVAARVPSGILCLLSALQYHGIGTRLSPDVWIAIPRGQRPAKIDVARVRFVHFSGVMQRSGVIEIDLDGVPSRITDPARTVVDCLRLSRTVDRETAVEALRASLESRLVTPNALLRMARTCGCFERVRTAIGYVAS